MPEECSAAQRRAHSNVRPSARTCASVGENGGVTSATDTPLPAVTRLIATDLDGTLLRDDKTLSARTVAALAAAEEAGIEVFFVTGRPARWMDVVSNHVQGHGLAICANGAVVTDLRADGASLIHLAPGATTARNGRIVSMAKLEDGDVVAIGSVELTFQTMRGARGPHAFIVAGIVAATTLAVGVAAWLAFS